MPLRRTCGYYMRYVQGIRYLSGYYDMIKKTQVETDWTRVKFERISSDKVFIEI